MSLRDTVVNWLKAEADVEEKRIEAAVVNQFETLTPKLIHAVIVAMVQTAGQITVDEAHKLTSIIPGHLDDDIVNTLIGGVYKALGQTPPPL